jgi:hypothetical protein
LKDLINSTHGSKEATRHLKDTAVTNHFSDGVYARELQIPQHAVIASRVHKAGCINIISKGLVRIYDTHGVTSIRAPRTFSSPAGTQRVVVALEDTVWTTVHHTMTQDASKLYDELTVETYEEYINQTPRREV